MTAIGGRSSPEKSSSPNGIWLIRELLLDRAVGQPAPRPQRTLVGQHLRIRAGRRDRFSATAVIRQ